LGCNRPPEHQTDQLKIETPQGISSLKKVQKLGKERILKAVREKKQITYKGKPIKITADFSTETLKARRAWGEIFRALMKITSTPGFSTQQNYHSK
jgi:hypothetical protein